MLVELRYSIQNIRCICDFEGNHAASLLLIFQWTEMQEQKSLPEPQQMLINKTLGKKFKFF